MGIYNPHKLPTPSSPPTSGWRYLDGTEWKDDATLTVEKKSASSAVVPRTKGTATATAADVSVAATATGVSLDLNGITLNIRIPQAPAPPAAAPCANRIQVLMGNNLALNQNSDIDQA